MANFDEWISAQPRFVATRHEKDVPTILEKSVAPSSNSLVDLLASMSTVPALDEKSLTRQQRYADLDSLSKDTNAKASTNQDSYLSTKAHYIAAAKDVDATIEYKDGCSQSCEIKDPLVRKSKGRPRNTRFKAGGETPKRKRQTKSAKKQDNQKEKGKKAPKKQVKRTELSTTEKGKEKNKKALAKQVEKIYNTRLASQHTVEQKQKRKVQFEQEERRQSKRQRIKRM